MATIKAIQDKGSMFDSPLMSFMFPVSDPVFISSSYLQKYHFGVYECSGRGLHLLFCFAKWLLWILPILSGWSNINSLTELKAMPVLIDELHHFLFRRLGTESHLADVQTFMVCHFKKTNPKRVFKQNSQRTCNHELFRKRTNFYQISVWVGHIAGALTPRF